MRCVAIVGETMARILIVGCGGRGQALARDLVAGGHAVRGTTRDPRRFPEIEAAGAAARAPTRAPRRFRESGAGGAEPYLGDPDRVMTLMDALTATTVVCW